MVLSSSSSPFHHFILSFIANAMFHAYPPDRQSRNVPSKARPLSSASVQPPDNGHSTSPASENNNTNNNKRKSVESAGPRQRSKRNRYISIACNECKRRKIKCNGETPCQRCGNLRLECLYAQNCCANFKDSDDFRQMSAHIAALQQQVDSLYHNLNALRNHIDTVAITTQQQSASASASASANMCAQSPQPSPSSTSRSMAAGRRSKSTPNKHPKFHGPTSAAFNIGVAKSILQSMGITVPTSDDAYADVDNDDGEATSLHLPPQPPSPPRSFQNPHHAHVDEDPIWLLSREEAVRLVNLWQDEIGLMYPIIDTDKLLVHVGMLYDFMDAANRSGLLRIAQPGSDAMQDDATNVLKLVLACAMVLQASGKSELGKRVFENVRPCVDAQLLAPPDGRAVQMLILTAMYYFHQDEEQIAWRMVGLASRVSMEVGLHRKETYATQFATDNERNSALRLFWSLYVLDRRWSLGTGMPFAMQDADIDPLLPKPDESTPYLDAMIAYSAIGSKLWRSTDASTFKVSDEEIGYLDYQVLQWLQSIPPSLQFHGVDLPPSGYSPSASSAPEMATASTGGETRANHRLRILIYLRANQMRILIYRPVLHTPTSIAHNLAHANTVVDIARDTIIILHAMNARTDLYRTQQALFNYFLISALAVLFLAVANKPGSFADACREEFHLGTELVRGCLGGCGPDEGSFVGKRLWKTVRVLKEMGPKLGLSVTCPSDGQQGGRQGEGQSSAQQPPPPPLATLPATPPPPPPQDAHSHAAVAMVGLAGHDVDELAFLSNGGVGSQGDGIPDSPNGRANDLTSVFSEAAGGYGNVGYAMGPAAAVPVQGAPGGGEQVLPSIFANEDELGKILKDMF